MQIKEQYEKVQSELKSLRRKKYDYIGNDFVAVVALVKSRIGEKSYGKTPAGALLASVSE